MSRCHSPSSATTTLSCPVRTAPLQIADAPSRPRGAFRPSFFRCPASANLRIVAPVALVAGPAPDRWTEPYWSAVPDNPTAARFSRKLHIDGRAYSDARLASRSGRHEHGDRDQSSRQELDCGHLFDPEANSRIPRSSALHLQAAYVPTRPPPYGLARIAILPRSAISRTISQAATRLASHTALVSPMRVTMAAVKAPSPPRNGVAASSVSS